MPSVASDKQGKPRSRGRRRRTKRIEEVVEYAVSHRIRTHILIVLNEGTFTATQIAAIIDEPLNNVSNHIGELLERGSIEIAKTDAVRNVNRHWYRAVEMPQFSEAEWATLTPEQKQVTCGLVVQSMTAETMTGLWSGKMRDDPHLLLAWAWRNVDQQGRREIEQEQLRSWSRIQEIEVAAINRCAESGEELVSVLVSQTGFERARKGPVPPPESENGE
jgi:hypothetical protein